MIREPLSPLDTPASDPAPLPSAPPTAWAAVVFAAIFLILALYHSFLMQRRKAWFSWTIVAASITQCMSLVTYAYDLGYPASAVWYGIEGVVFPLAPTLTMIAYVQTFGRAAWHSVLPEPSELTRFRGFLRWNTSVFITFMIFSYLLILFGNIIVVARAPDAVVTTEGNGDIVNAAYVVVETGLIVQSLFLLAFMVLVWRWRSITHDWDVEWNDTRRRKWTWKALLVSVLVGAGLLMLRQAYLLVRFFSALQGFQWLHFVFDVLTLLATLIILAVWHPGRCLPQELTLIRLKSSRLTAGKQAGFDTDSEK